MKEKQTQSTESMPQNQAPTSEVLKVASKILKDHKHAFEVLGND